MSPSIFLWAALGGALGALVYAFHAARRWQVARWGRPWLDRLDGLNRLFCRRYHRLDAPLLPLPERGCAIVCANHTSGLDALLLLAASPRPLRFLIAREQYEVPLLKWLYRAVGCIPVDRRGRPEAALREALAALRAGEVLAIFPHGRIHLDKEGPRRLKPGAVRLAQRTGCPIYPVRIEGVRLQGWTLLSVPVRSRARLRYGPVLHCDGADAAACLRRLGRLLAPPAP